METLQWLNAFIISLGIPTIIGALLFIGRKLQVLDMLNREVFGVLGPDIKDARERLARMEGRQRSQKPRSRVHYKAN